MRKNMKKVLFVALLLVILISVCWAVTNIYAYHREIVLINGDGETAIYIEPDCSASRAAADYLAFAVERELGTELPVVTEMHEGGHYIEILCAAESDDSNPEAETPVYSISLEGENLMIRTQPGCRCFGAVRAIADRWLQVGGGGRNGVELRASRRMIEKELAYLSTAVPGEIRILTQNLRNADDGKGKTVEDRAVWFFRQIKQCKPDLIGTQECTFRWKKILQQGMGDMYGFFGVSTEGPDEEDGEWNAILYRKDRFVLQDGGTFWLSNTPHTAPSKLNYDGPYRICTWVLLTDTETGKTFLYSNTHLNHKDSEFYQEVRARQAEILLHTLRGNGNKLEEYPGFLTGDFNGESYEPFYPQVTAWYRDAASTAITDSSKVHYSYHGYGKEQWMIDYCFHSPRNVTVLDYHILSDVVEGYVSDHYGLLVTAVLN